MEFGLQGWGDAVVCTNDHRETSKESLQDPISQVKMMIMMGLSLSFESLTVLFFTLVTNLLPCERISPLV